MKTIILTLILSAFIFNCKAQNVDYIEKYHKVIYQGEKQLLFAHYDSALLYYQRAFANVPYGFSKDYRAAASIAHLCNNDKLAKSYLDSAIVRGFPYEYTKRAVKMYYKRKERIAFKIHYDSIYKLGLLKRDSNVQKKIQELIQRDQSHRRNLVNRTKEDDSLLNVDDSFVSAQLIKLLEQQRFGEKELGFIQYYNFTTILSHYVILWNEDMFFSLYKNGQIARLDYLFCILRKTIQGGYKSKYVTKYDKDGKLIDGKFHGTSEMDIIRIADGVPTKEEYIKLSKLKIPYYQP